ncbi:MAG: DedA family protein [Chloroflexi bacterium]|nr:DedA family protein [Chloroflexota bacterium]
MDELIAGTGYLGLLLVSFLAATLLPISSELAVALMARSGYDSVLTVAVATLGNSLGAIVNYCIGAGAARSLARHVGTSSDRLTRARTTYERWGAPILFFSWLPVIGDPLTVVAGAVRLPLLVFTVWVVAGKLARYVAVMVGAHHVL